MQTQLNSRPCLRSCTAVPAGRQVGRPAPSTPAALKVRQQIWRMQVVPVKPVLNDDLPLQPVRRSALQVAKEEVEVSTNNGTVPSLSTPTNMMEFDELSDIIRCPCRCATVACRMQSYVLRIVNRVAKHYICCRHIPTTQVCMCLTCVKLLNVRTYCSVSLLATCVTQALCAPCLSL